MNDGTRIERLGPYETQSIDAGNCGSMSKYSALVTSPFNSSTPPSQFALTFEEVGRLLDAGLIMMDEHHVIVAATTLAREYLLADTGLTERSGKLQFCRSSAERHFRVFLDTAFTADSASQKAGQSPDLFGVPDPQGHIHYVIWLLSWLSGVPDGCVVLAIADLAAKAEGIKRTGVAAVFGLSAREAQLAELFSKGFRLEQIAMRMGVTLNTARVHLHQVFLKTNCAGQLELARAFARIRATTICPKPALPMPMLLGHLEADGYMPP